MAYYSRAGVDQRSFLIFQLHRPLLLGFFLASIYIFVLVDPFSFVYLEPSLFDARKELLVCLAEIDRRPQVYLVLVYQERILNIRAFC